MLGNGCAPIAYAEWLIKRGMLKDRAAREHVAGLISDHKSGKLEIAGRTCYVMAATLPNGTDAPAKMPSTCVRLYCHVLDRNGLHCMYSGWDVL